jgi:probable rRNA maturation factor
MTRARRVRPRAGRLTVSVSAAGLSARGAAGLGRWLAAAAPARASGEVAVAIVSDRRMRALIHTFRGVDRATDVLSFEAGREGPLMGDIAIALGVARRQAAGQGHSLTTELRILALHGLLHLLGYDHERDRGAMRAVEERLRRRLGLPVGLIARSRRESAQE